MVPSFSGEFGVSAWTLALLGEKGWVESVIVFINLARFVGH